MRILILIFAIVVTSIWSYAQKKADHDWNGFSQRINVTEYRGGKFRLKAFVRAENTDKQSKASLWARVDNRKGMGFFDKMANRPIQLQLIDLALYQPKIDPGQLKTISCPTLVMAGSRDIIKEEHTKLISCNIRQSKLVIFEGGSHYEPQENSERFNRTVLDFFIDQ